MLASVLPSAKLPPGSN